MWEKAETFEFAYTTVGWGSFSIGLFFDLRCALLCGGGFLYSRCLFPSGEAFGFGVTASQIFGKKSDFCREKC